MVTHFFLLDVKNDVQLIEQRQEYHRNVWPEIEKGIKQSRIEKLNV